MSALPEAVAKAFCQYCDWAQQCWLLRKHLYDENPQRSILNSPWNRHLFVQLEKILQEYWIHQVAKLHDRPKRGSRPNLTVDYILTEATWRMDTERKLRELREQLDQLSQTIRSARNRLLSHNDLEVILSGVDLGAFEPGVDTKYFEALRAFASLVHEEVVGGPYAFDDLVSNDIDALMATLGKGLKVS